jgi:CubicO group peptidase (beta-lactamase class C family)
MRKVLLLLFALIIVCVPLVAIAQEEGEEEGETWDKALDRILGQWKRSFAAPSYGIALFSARVDGPGSIGDDQSQFLVPAIDLRIMRGVNVSKRGGFFTGIETGVLVFTNIGGGAQFSDTVFYPEFNAGLGTTLPLDFGATMDGGLVFLMSRYGLRIDLGVSLIGISLGLDLGAGASLFSGGYRFYVGSDPDNTIVDVGSGSSAAIMGLIVDGNAEAALRLGKNFRIFAKAGAIISPIALPDIRRDEYRYIAEADFNNEPWVTPEDRQRYLLSQYRLELNAFALSARVGFALNFD